MQRTVQFWYEREQQGDDEGEQQEAALRLRAPCGAGALRRVPPLCGPVRLQAGDGMTAPEAVLTKLMRTFDLTRDQAERVADQAEWLYRSRKYKTATGAVRRAVYQVTTADAMAHMYFPKGVRA